MSEITNSIPLIQVEFEVSIPLILSKSKLNSTLSKAFHATVWDFDTPWDAFRDHTDKLGIKGIEAFTIDEPEIKQTIPTKWATDIKFKIVILLPELEADKITNTDHIKRIIINQI